MSLHSVKSVQPNVCGSTLNVDQSENDEWPSTDTRVDSNNNGHHQLIAFVISRSTYVTVVLPGEGELINRK